MADCCAVDGCSCGLQQAGGEGAHFGRRYLLGFHLVVHHDAAADTVTVALRRDTSDARRRGDGEFQPPWEPYPVKRLGVTSAVEIADVGQSPWWSEDLVPQVLGVE